VGGGVGGVKKPFLFVVIWGRGRGLIYFEKIIMGVEGGLN
jgi:hypothetical protein